MAEKTAPKNSTKEARYLNRELSWLKFNERVLEEAASDANPLLERLKFLAIFETNLDEFYMVRVSGLIEQWESGILEATPDGLTPNEQLDQIQETAEPNRQRGAEIFHHQLKPLMEKAGIHVRGYADLTERQRGELRRYFEREVFPLCTPIILHPAPSVPFISNRSLNVAVELGDLGGDTRLARIKVPPVIPRAVRISPRRNDFVLLEEVIQANLQAFFPGVPILGSWIFRLVRDADVEIRDSEAADLLKMIEETIRLRRLGDPVLLQHEPDMPQHVRELLMELLELDEEDVFRVRGPLGFEFLYELAKIDKPSLRFPVHVPHVPEGLGSSSGLFEAISAGDVLLHHPYDSFRTVEDFTATAVRDPHVMGIKQTLYRVGSESPIVESLLEAAEQGKQVAAMVELKARFDESNNLVWARAMERAGVHVAYGFPQMKTHCKLCLVVRREPTGVKMYAHIGTGNYNPATARLYTDLGLFTADPAITQDISELFNFLTGFSRQTEYRKLLVAPITLRRGITDRVLREAELGEKGRIIWKLNSLVDPLVIESLYTASRSGVSIDLIVRGVCCLRPGVPGMSENIRVRSIVGRFLEHSRVYYFGNGGKPDVLIGSADAMRRNLDRRVEVLVPVEDPRLVKHLHDDVLVPCLHDNVRAWILDGSGEYARCVCDGPQRFDVQAWLIKNPSSKKLLR